MRGLLYPAFLASAVLIGAGPSQAASASSRQGADGQHPLVLVRDGCGPGAFRTPLGVCRPFRRGPYVDRRYDYYRPRGPEYDYFYQHY